MSLHRPLVSVYAAKPQKNGEVKSQVALPDVFSSPIRVDIVQTIVAHQLRNSRQPYAVNRFAGLQTAAESWGTGRAVSRIPRVPGGGTHRAGQGAFGNMCRGGRLFAPTKTWRRWSFKISLSQRRFARASAIAASSVPALVEARGHRISKVSELPLVVSDEIESFKKTKDAVQLLKRLGCFDDVMRVKNNKHLKPGKGKYRNRRYKVGKGPLIIYKQSKGIEQAFRNIIGVDLCRVDALNLLKLAPGAHVGRLIIWSESAFNGLNDVFGSYGNKGALSKLKKRNGEKYTLPNAVLLNSDIASIIGSDEVQSVVNDKKKAAKKLASRKNPLKNRRAMLSLNPFYAAKNKKVKK